MPILVVHAIDPDLAPNTGASSGIAIEISDYARHQIANLLAGSTKGWLDASHRDTLAQLAQTARDADLKLVIGHIDRSGRAWVRIV